MKATKYPVHGSTLTMFTPPAKKLKKQMVETKEFGLGYILPHEPKVQVKRGQFVNEKIVVHLVKENLEPRLMNGKPKMVLMAKDSYTVLAPVEEPKTERVKKARGENGEAAPKDFTQYKFDGKILGKGKLVLAIVQKYVADNNPSFAELRKVFPENVVRAYKGLFISLEEAMKINEANNNRSRFFVAKEDVIKLKGNAKIAVTNQVTADLVNRMIPIAEKLNYNITTTAGVKPEVEPKAPKVKAVKAKAVKAPKAKVVKVKKVNLSNLTAKEIIEHVEKATGEKIILSLKNKQAIVKKAQVILGYKK